MGIQATILLSYVGATYVALGILHAAGYVALTHDQATLRPREPLAYAATAILIGVAWPLVTMLWLEGEDDDDDE